MIRYVITIALVMFFFNVNAAIAEIYKYRDAEGIMRYTYDLADVPEDQRPKVQTYEETPTETQALPAPEEGVAPAETQKLDGEEDAPVVDEKKIEELNQKKKELDTEFSALMEEKYKLLKEKERLDALPGSDTEGAAKYDKQAKDLNRKITDYQKRQEAFQKEAEEAEKALKKSKDSEN